MAIQDMKPSPMRSGWKLWRRKQHSQPSRTDGKSKNENCQTDPLKKFFACNPRARFHPQYLVWHEKFKAIVLGGSQKKNT